MSLSKSIIGAFLVVSAAYVTAAEPATQPASGAAPAAKAEPADQVNPMTGRSASEEDLTRQLSKAKLSTQIGQELVKQAQNNADLALATLRQEAEKNRLRGETQALNASSPAKAAKGSTGAKPLAALPPLGALPPSMTAMDPNRSPDMQGYPASPSMPPKPASGVVRIGTESLPVASSYQGSAAQVQWVDTQARQVARAGTPLQPINVQPATGVLTMPQGSILPPGYPQ